MASQVLVAQGPRLAQQHVRDHYGLTVPAPSLYRTRDAVMRNAVPGEFRDGRWWIDVSDLDVVARGLGMVPATAKPVQSAAVRQPVAA